jgi:hypothetical protein
MTRAKRNAILWMVVLLSGIWLWKFVSEAELRRLDKEVDRLCAVDGKTVIYETVKLPASKFNEYGQATVPQNGRDDSDFGYFVRGSERILAGPGQAPGAQLLRYEWRVVRSADGKVMAEHINYTRSGGNWLEGVPGMDDGRSCPGPVPINFRKQIFIKE